MTHPARLELRGHALSEECLEDVMDLLDQAQARIMKEILGITGDDAAAEDQAAVALAALSPLKGRIR